MGAFKAEKARDFKAPRLSCPMRAPLALDGGSQDGIVKGRGGGTLAVGEGGLPADHFFAVDDVLGTDDLAKVDVRLERPEARPLEELASREVVRLCVDHDDAAAVLHHQVLEGLEESLPHAETLDLGSHAQPDCAMPRIFTLFQIQHSRPMIFERDLFTFIFLSPTRT